MKPETPVRYIPKIGPKYEQLLNKLDIFTVVDLLYHIPARYEDYSEITNISLLAEGMQATVQSELLSVTNIVTKNRKRITIAKFTDLTGEVQAVWFNQFYIKDSLSVGDTYYVSGKLGTFDKRPAFTVPAVERVSENNVNTARIVPVYPETNGLSSKWLRGKIDYIVNKTLLELDEFLPDQLIEKYKLCSLNESIKHIHFPDSLDSVKRGKDRIAFDELFLELINVERKKKDWQENRIGMQLEVQNFIELIESLPFKLTDSQENAIQEIISDLVTHKPMNRLLEGDVGTGKTVVAVICAYLNHLNGYKTLYMAPTEMLAKQHFETFNNFLAPFNVVVDLTTGKSKTSLENFNILVGTHALLFNEDLDDIGLVIIDEQHRFGVEQRAKLTDMNSNGKTPNVLTMTATPIPRTMALTLYGDLEISDLKTAPNKNKKITTRVIPTKNRTLAYEWVNKQNQPTFIVCPFIDESEHEMFENIKAATKEYEELKSTIFKNKNVGLLHGRMKPAEKEDIVSKFRAGEIDVLISTPVIEVGIDIPDAVIMVIESAERYGLASLHQLRGRVGRGQKEGFCLLIPSTFSKSSYQRLKYLETISSGLELAEIDMQMRGHGDLYGTMQSGFKKFRVATLSNIELLETAKQEARFYYNKLEEYPLLNRKYKETNADNIAFN